MKPFLAIVLSCYALVTGVAQEKKEGSGSSTLHLTGMSPDRQIGKPQAFISEAYSWYQSGKVRVFFSADFARALGPISDVTDYNDEFQAILGRLFRSGALTGEMLFSGIKGLPPTASYLSRSDSELGQRSDVFHAMETYPGPLVKILHYKVLSRSETRFETITYELWVSLSRSESGWGEFHRFRITTKGRFLLGPKLVKFEYCGMQI